MPLPVPPEPPSVPMPALERVPEEKANTPQEKTQPKPSPIEPKPKPKPQKKRKAKAKSKKKKKKAKHTKGSPDLFNFF